jgi:hypothetical protein
MTGRWLWHPESPVVRTWFGWFIGSKEFATLKECIR